MSNATTKYQIVDTNIQTLGQMRQRGNVVIDGILQQETWNTTININRQLIIKTPDASPIFPMLVSPTEITMNSTLHVNSSNATPCVFNSTTGANAHIAFRYLSNFSNVGMDGGNFRIKSNWLLSHSIPAGANTASTVAVQIKQDAKTSFANGVNVWGNLNTYQNLDSNGTATFRRDIEIRPTTLNTQAGIFMRGGSGSVDKFWYLGRGAYNAAQNNL